MSRSISGLGIDMGPVDVPIQGARKRSQTMDSATQHEFTASLNQYNDNRRKSQLPTRRPTTSSSISDRKVRIASGQPGLLNESDHMQNRIVSRNQRLGAAVAAMPYQSWDNASSSTSPSDIYSSDASPRTDHSSSSAGTRSSNASSLKRNQTIRKQRSQPDLNSGRALAREETMSRSTSTAFNLRDYRLSGSDEPSQRTDASDKLRQYASDVGSDSAASSLGRSREIPRSGSRGGLYNGSRGRGARGGHMRSATWDARSAAAAAAAAAAAESSERKGGALVPDGFGGYIEVDEADGFQHSAPTAQKTVKESSPPARPVTSQSMHNIESERHRPVDAIRNLRVGSFYGPDGSEMARLDDEGRLSRLGTEQGDRQQSLSASRSSVSFATSTSSQRSRARSQSGGPRPHFMSSPSKGAANASNDAQSEVSASSQQNGPAKLHKSVSMRSQRGFQGLEGAEKGMAMVSLDRLNESFQQGERIEPGRIRLADQESILASAQPTPQQGSASGYNSDSHLPRYQSYSGPDGMNRASTDSNMSTSSLGNGSTMLDRQNTLISTTANPARKAKELNRLLANNNRKIISSASSSAGDSISSASTDSLASSRSLSRSSTMNGIMPPAVLEQGRSGKSRVDVDLVLESDLVVEGGYLRGRLEIKVRKSSDKDGALMLTQPKVRVVGFEELLNDDTRHIFYHHATVIDGSSKIGNAPSRAYVLHGTPSFSPEADNRSPLACFASAADGEGYCVAKEGSHSIPFALEMPVGKGAKGSYRGKHAIVRYIVIGSVKLKSANGSNRSIAHFYRHVELFPYLNPAVILSTSSRPIQARASKGLFLGGSGKVHLSASLHRSTWVAGQRVYVNIKVDNETNKKVKSLTLAVVRTVTLYRPRPEFDVNLSAPDDPSETYIDPDACTTSTSRKKITEEVLEMGQKGAKGLVTARGWWTGVEAGEAVEFSHNMKLPVDALTITRGRHVEVLYSIKVSVSSSLSSDVSIELPVRVVNFVSLDPPPLKSASTKVTRSWTRDNHQRNAMSDSEAPMIERMRTMEALRSPHALNAGLGLDPTQAAPSAYPPPQVAVQHMIRPAQESAGQLQVPGMDGSRRLQHQKSLDFINHAIRSATARKSRSNEPSPTGLGIELDDNRTPPAGHSSASSSSGASFVSSAVGAVHPSCMPYEHAPPPTASNNKHSGRGLYQHPVNLPITAVSLDDVDDDDDSDDDLGVGNQTLNLNDESVAEVDFVIGSARLDGGESSPAFQQRQTVGDYEEPSMLPDEDEGDSSTSTITSQRGIREEDEYDEEEERLQRQEVAAAVQRASAPVYAAEDEPKPLAHSPPKFATNPHPPTTNRLATLPRTKPSVPRLRVEAEESDDGYSTSSSRRSVVRTQSDLESRLGRSSTIIRGPSADVSRPISPSKHAPSPTKSALKSKSSFTFATSDHPVKASANASVPKTVANAPKLKAKVSASQLPRLAGPRANPSSSGPPSRVPQKKMTVGRGKYSDAESNASLSPASSASVATPESDYPEKMDDVYIEEYQPQQRQKVDASADHDMNVKLQAVDVTPRKGQQQQQQQHSTPTGLPSSVSAPSLARSTSTHNLRGSNVVVPSVRDKIAMLENRKQALRDFTGTSSPSASMGTPTKSASSKSASRETTPSRVQAATRHLERNNSLLSDVSSQADYLKHTPSIASFKAPLLNPSG